MHIFHIIGYLSKVCTVKVLCCFNFDKDILSRLFQFKFPATFEEVRRAQNILVVGDG